MNSSGSTSNLRGRALLAPWLLASLAILCSFALTRLWRQGSLSGLFAAQATPARPAAESAELEIWQGTLELDSGDSLECSLVPWLTESVQQSFRSRSLAKRWGLPPGELLRLILNRSAPSSEVLVVNGFELFDGTGRCIQTLGTLLPEDWAGDPLLTLLGRRGAILDAEDREQIAGWGRAPELSARLVLHFAEGPMELQLEPARVPKANLPRAFVQAQAHSSEHLPELEDGGDGEAWLARIVELEAELALERQRVRELEQARVEREEEILHFNSMLGSLPLPSESRRRLGLEASEQVIEEPAASPAPETPDPDKLRAEEVKLALRTLLTLEGMYALDLLEVGEVHAPKAAGERLEANGERVLVAAQPGWIGPVIFRLLDPLGRLDGSLYAERLHLEGSRSSRTLQVILSDGYESHLGERTPFEAGVRRISLPLVDPERWIQRVPELFSPVELAPANDDGLWDLASLRLELNELLGQSSEAGWFRFHGFGGVQGSELMEVQMQEFDNRGHMRRRLFADRLSILIDANGVSLRLSGGASADADGMHPFRDGRLSIFLPAADPLEWQKQRLPGVAAFQPAPEEH